MKVFLVLGFIVHLQIGVAAQQATPTPTPTIREEVTVNISADAEQTMKEVAKTVDVIDGRQMRERADFALIETLRTIPGFRIQQSGGFGRLATVKSRGLRNSDTAVLLDGIRFRDPTAIQGDASPFISDFTLTSVAEVEVLRGSGSSLYGTNAIGGVIDFQTPSARAETHGQIAGAFGGLGLGRFRGLISHGWDKIGIGGGVSRTVYTKGIDGNDEAHNTNLQGRADARPFEKTNISGRSFFSNADVQLNVNPDTLGTLPSTATIIDARPGVTFTPDANDPDSFQASRFFSGQFVVEHAVDDKLSIGGYYQGLSTRRNLSDGTLGPGFQGAFTSNYYGVIHTGNAHVDWTPVRQNSLKLGYEFELEDFQNNGGTPNPADRFLTKANQSSNTLYIQDLVSLLDGNFQVAGGFRAQWFNLRQPTFSATPSPYAGYTLASPPAAYTGDGAISYFIQKTGTKLRAHVGNGYHAPSMYERFGTFFFFNTFFQQGNPELKPERSIGYDAGIDQYFLSEKVKATATWFYTEIKDEITYLPIGFNPGPAYFNLDKHFSRGAEFSVNVKPTGCFDFFASYTFTNSDVRGFRRPTLGTLTSTDRPAFGIPDHQFTLVVTQRYKGFWINADFLATSSYLAPVFSSTAFANYTYRFDGNRRADVTAGYGFDFAQNRWGLRIYGTIENFFDNDYFENGFRTVPRTARIGTTLSF